MNLQSYRHKRSFDKTPEPKGSKKGKTPSLIFVVQKHAASHLHYDFRLEAEGVLKSWAVPKGPSLNPKDKRLAMMVEDHPYDYRDFEGIIPAGNYGAGAVIVWDTGTYYPIDEENYEVADDKAIVEGIEKGKLLFFLNGKKLQGIFTLVKMAHGSHKENEWLLIKHADKFATETDVLEQNRSVLSKKTLEQVAKQKKIR